MASGGTRAVVAAMIANAIIAVAKFGAAAVTGSSAMFSEGIHSVADTGNQVLLLFGHRRSGRAADRRHPFGYGPELYFWSLIVAMILFGLGGGFSMYKGIAHLGHPQMPTDPGWNYAILAVALVVEALALRVGLRELGGRGSGASLWRRVRDCTDPRVFVPVAEDISAIAGVIVAFLGIALARALDMPALDAIASIVIGFILAAVALFLAYETRTLLVGEAISDPLRRNVERICLQEEGVDRIARILGVYLGPDEILLTLGLGFRPGQTVQQASEAVERIERRIRAEDPRVTRVFVEPEAATDPGGLSTPF